MTENRKQSKIKSLIQKVKTLGSSKMAPPPPLPAVNDSSKVTSKKISNIDIDDDTSDDDEIKTLNYIIVDTKDPSSLDVITYPIFGDITKISAFKQFVIGGAVGCASGYLAIQVGRFAAFSLGSALLLIQIAQYNDYISVDWTKVYHLMTRTEAKIRYALLKHRESIIQKLSGFFEENFFLASGFSAGVALVMYM